MSQYSSPGVYPPYTDDFSPDSPWMDLPLAEATYQTMNDNCSDNMETPEASQGRIKEVTQHRSGRTELLKEQEQVFSLHIHFLKIELGFCEKLSCRITASLWFHQLRHKRLFVVCCKF